MENKDHILEQIDSYLDGEMSQEEKLAFEEMLKTSPEIKHIFEENKKLYEAFRTVAKEKEEKLASWRLEGLALLQKYEAKELIPPADELLEEGKKIRLPFYRQRWVQIYSLAAVITMLLMIIIFPISQPKSPQELFAQYYDESAGALNRSFTSKSTVNESEQIKMQLEQAMAKKNFSLANTLLDSLLHTSSQDPLFIYQKGVVQLRDKQYKESIEAFTKVVKESNYYEWASWHQSLAYLALGDQINAQKQLAVIADDNNHYKNKEAQEILKELE